MQQSQKKSIKSVLLWPILIISAISLQGCAGLGTREHVIETVCKPLEKTPLDIDVPAPVRVDPIKWVVITPSNSEEVFRNLHAKGENLALFSLTDDGYKSLSLSWAEIRNLVKEQRSIIVKYKEYYENDSSNIRR